MGDHAGPQRVGPALQPVDEEGDEEDQGRRLRGRREAKPPQKDPAWNAHQQEEQNLEEVDPVDEWQWNPPESFQRVALT